MLKYLFWELFCIIVFKTGEAMYFEFQIYLLDFYEIFGYFSFLPTYLPLSTTEL